MNCVSCATTLPDGTTTCPSCGARQPPASPPPSPPPSSSTPPPAPPPSSGPKNPPSASPPSTEPQAPPAAPPSDGPGSEPRRKRSGKPIAIAAAAAVGLLLVVALAVAWMGGGGDGASAPQELHLDEASFSASGQDCDTRIPVEVHVVNGHTEPMHDVVVEFDAYDSDGFAADETVFEYVGTLAAGERRVVAGQLDFTPERCGTADTVNVEAVAGVCLDASCGTYEVLDELTQQITM